MIELGFLVMWLCVIALLFMEIKRCNNIIKYNKRIKSKKDENI